MLLNFGKDGDNAESDAKEHIEGDEEFVQFAFAHMGSSVVHIEQDDGSNRATVEDPRDWKQGSLPTSAFCFFVIPHPSFSPRVGEIDYQNQLDQNEAKATDHSKYHPDVTKRASRDEESADHSSDNDEVFQPPETILQRKLVKRDFFKRKVELCLPECQLLGLMRI